VVKNFADHCQQLILDSMKIRRMDKSPIACFSSEEYEEIDRFCILTVAQAEHQCRKFRMGQVAFSLILSEARFHIKAWSFHEKKAKGLRISPRSISK
jgi:hypothetical protein